MEEEKTGREDRARTNGGPSSSGAGEPPRGPKAPIPPSSGGDAGGVLPGARSALREPYGRWKWKEKLASHRLAVAVVGFALVFLAGIGGSYLFFYAGAFSGWTGGRAAEETPEGAEHVSDLTTVEVYYPFGGGLNMEDRRVLKHGSTNKMAEAVLLEFLKGPSRADSYVPAETALLGIYAGADGVLYIDLSHEFRSNFQGDALAEFLLLRALYESIMSNVPRLKGLKVLIEGKEVESIGGHISLPGTLGEAVSHIMLERHEQR